MRIAILGDYEPGFEPHVRTDTCLSHYRSRYPKLQSCWTASDEWDADPRFHDADAIMVSPGVFRNFEEGIAGVRAARQSGKPTLAICGGCQSALIEFARNVMGLEGAAHGAVNSESGETIVRLLDCSLRGRRMNVRLDPAHWMKGVYGTGQTEEEYYCRFGLDPKYEPAFSSAGLAVAARSDDGEARIMVLDDHDFYVLTVFVPQLNFCAETGHPILNRFMAEAFGSAAR